MTLPAKSPAVEVGWVFRSAVNGDAYRVKYPVGRSVIRLANVRTGSVRETTITTLLNPALYVRVEGV